MRQELPLYRIMLMIGLLAGLASFTYAQEGGDSEQAGGQPQGPPATPVSIDPARLEQVRDQRSVTGDIQAHRRSVVASEEEGIVNEVPFDEGSTVKKGEVLARLDARLLEFELAELQAELAEAQAMVDVQRAELAQVQNDLNSIEDLSQRGAAKPKELLDAQTAVSAGEARLSGAERAVTTASAQIDRLRQRIQNKTIRAPFDGVIVEKYTEVGQWVSKGGMIVELIESGLVDAVLDVPEIYVNHLEPGIAVDVNVSALSEPVLGRVRAIVPLGNPRARTYPVKVELEDRGGEIKPGMSVLVWVPTGTSQEAITIRKDAILRNETSTFVYVVRGGQAFSVNVEPQFSAGASRVVVRGSLQSGDKVIVEGNERLYPSAPVRVVNQNPSEESAARARGTEVDRNAATNAPDETSG